MSNIAIITDTDSSLPTSLTDQLGVIQVPITIHFGEQMFTTGIDINDQELFTKIDQLNKLPTTAAPSPGAYMNAYQSAFDSGAESIICICISSAMSAIYNSAMMAAENFPGRKITVIDSGTLSLGQGFAVLEAVKAVRENAGYDEVVAIAKSVSERAMIFGALPTLKYLAMSGRVGKLAAGMASVLNIHPILVSRNGKLELLEKVRTHRVAVERLVELCQQSLGNKGIQHVGFIHVNNPDGAADLEHRLRAVLPLPEKSITVEFTAGLAVHTGSGLIGVAFVSSE
jgi:DegV family protein with EDD domain